MARVSPKPLISALLRLKCEQMVVSFLEFLFALTHHLHDLLVFLRQVVHHEQSHYKGVGRGGSLLEAARGVADQFLQGAVDGAELGGEDLCFYLEGTGFKGGGEIDA